MHTLESLNELEVGDLCAIYGELRFLADKHLVSISTDFESRISVLVYVGVEKQKIYWFHSPKYGLCWRVDSYEMKLISRVSDASG